MGRCLEVYAIDHDWLRNTIGSGDDKIRRAISGRFRTKIYQDNDWLDLSNDRGAPNLFEAVRDLIMGDARDLDSNLYWYAYKYVVGFNGRFLDNSEFCPFRGDYLDDVTADLRALGADLDLNTLAWGGAPTGVDGPRDQSEISHGSWEADAITGALAALTGKSELTPACASVRGWLETAESQGRVLVGIHTI